MATYYTIDIHMQNATDSEIFWANEHLSQIVGAAAVQPPLNPGDCNFQGFLGYPYLTAAPFPGTGYFDAVKFTFPGSTGASVRSFASGFAAGMYFDNAFASHPFAYDGGYVELSLPPDLRRDAGVADDPNTDNCAYASNINGITVGAYRSTTGNFQAFIYQPGQPGKKGQTGHLDVPVPVPGNVKVKGINTRGDLAGFYIDNDVNYGFLWHRNDPNFSLFPNKGVEIIRYFNSGPIYYSTKIHSINDNGDLAGEFDPTGNGDATGFIFRNRIFTPIEPPGSTSSLCTCILNDGRVVGNYWEQDIGHGFVYVP